ncbi:hypothetical protein OQA88_5533 [Cercophora sp. LCS_1]
MEKLDQILAKHTVSGQDTINKLPGTAFIICNKEEILYQGSSGRTSLDITSPPFTPQTWTWVASMSKDVPITDSMALAERGVVSLDTDIRPIVPELSALQILKGFDADDKPILEDNTRVGADIADPDLQKWSRSIGRTTACLFYTLEGWSVPLKFPPGEGWYYGGGTEFAGVAIERITSQSLQDYMSDAVFKPLHLNSTSFSSIPPPPDATSAGCTMRNPDGTLSLVPTPVPKEPELLSLGSGLRNT